MFRVILDYTQDSYSNTLSGILLTYLSLYIITLLVSLDFTNRSLFIIDLSHCAV